MFGKTFLALIISSVFAFAINVITASKAELMTIKGIGAKKAEAIIDYRAKNKIKTADDLKGVKGVGKALINNLKNDIKKGGAKKKETPPAKPTTKKELPKK